jgi:hypothetical protein
LDTSESSSEIAGNFFKCGAGERWRRSVESVVWEMKKYYKESKRSGISHKQKGKEDKLDWSHLA